MFTDKFLKEHDRLRRILLEEHKKGNDPKKTKPEEFKKWADMELLIKTEYF